jgi:hypothetical protein
MGAMDRAFGRGIYSESRESDFDPKLEASLLKAYQAGWYAAKAGRTLDEALDLYTQTIRPAVSGKEKKANG